MISINLPIKRNIWKCWCLVGNPRIRVGLVGTHPIMTYTKTPVIVIDVKCSFPRSNLHFPTCQGFLSSWWFQPHCFLKYESNWIISQTLGLSKSTKKSLKPTLSSTLSVRTTLVRNLWNHHLVLESQIIFQFFQSFLPRFSWSFKGHGTPTQDIVATNARMPTHTLKPTIHCTVDS